jgi:hypothetical protein
VLSTDRVVSKLDLLDPDLRGAELRKALQHPHACQVRLHRTARGAALGGQHAER